MADRNRNMFGRIKEKTIEHPRLGSVLLRKSSRTHRMSIKIHPVKGIVVTVPYWQSFLSAESFLNAKETWVESTMARIREKSPEAVRLTAEEVERLRKQAKATLPFRLEELALKYGFSYNRVTIKHNISNWGSCSRKGNINLNMSLMRLPDDLRDYVILHELCHLRFMDHGPQFHALLEDLCRSEFRDEYTNTSDNDGKVLIHLEKRRKLKENMIVF